MSELRKKKTATNMVYSPDHHIPLGQAVKTPDGEYGLRIKKDKTTYEVVTIGKLMTQIVKAAAINEIQECEKRV